MRTLFTFLLLGCCLGTAAAQSTWTGTTADLSDPNNWTPAGVPSAASADQIVFDGSSPQAATTFNGGTFSANPGLGGITVAATQTDPLSIDNVGTAGSVFRLANNAQLSIAAGAGAVAFGGSGNSFFLNLGSGGAGNQLINQSANAATFHNNLQINASGGTGGLASFGGTGDWIVDAVMTNALTRGVVKGGDGTLFLNAFNTYTGGTRVDAGTLSLGAGGSTGTIRGSLTVEAGGSVVYTTGNTFGYTGGASINNLTINGGSVGSNFNNHFWNNFQLTMTGGQLNLGGSGANSNEWHNPTITILSSPDTATIQRAAGNTTASFRLRNSTSALFDVADGANPIDLLFAVPIIAENSTNSGITKTGTGTMRLAQNYTAGSVTINGGTLSLGPGISGDGFNPSGDTGIVINAGGTLRLDIDNPIQNAEVISISVGGTLDRNGRSDAIGGLSGAGAITGGGTLTLDLSQAATFSGTITGGSIHIRGDLQNGGSGKQTFTGTATGLGTIDVRRGNSANDNVLVEFGGSGSTSAAGIRIGIGGSGSASAVVSGSHTLNLGAVDIGSGSGQPGSMSQSGGEVNVSGLFRVGHWSNNTSTYTITGGTLTLSGSPTGTVNLGGVGEQVGVIYLGVDGTGQLVMEGGQVSANALVLDARGNTSGTDSFTLTGGTITLGANGIRSGNFDNNTSYEIALGGGTVAASASWSSPLTMGLTGTGGATTFDTAAHSITLSGQLTGSGGLSKAGAGTLTLSGANTYSGATTISAGTLALSGNGSIDNSPSLAIAPGATFDVAARTGGSYTYAGAVSGNGTINGQLTIGSGGRVAPGNSLGLLTVTGGPLTLNPGSTLEIELANPLTQGITPSGNLFLPGGAVNPATLTGGTPVGPPGLVNDRIAGNVTFASGSTLQVLTLDGLAPANLQKGLAWKIIDGTVTGDFSLAPGDFTLNGGSWATTQGGIDLDLPDLWGGSTTWGYYNWDLSLLQSHGILVLVPEPSRPLLLAAALTPLLLRRRRHLTP